MADKNRRSSIFTVKDAENTMLWFCFYVVVLIVFVILHQCFIKNDKLVNALYFVVDNISKIVAASTVLIILGEGIDIMLRRFREALQREKQIKAEAKAEGIAEGIAEGEDKVYSEIEAWQHRKTEAEKQGEEFTEPPPTRPPQPRA